MSCKYKNTECQSLCNITNGYCQFQLVDDICPIYFSYIDFDKKPKDDEKESPSEEK